MKRWILVLAVVMSVAAVPAARRGSVITFSRADVSRLFGEVCGTMPPADKPVYVHRSRSGERLFIVGGDHREAAVAAGTEGQQCMPLDEEIVDVWRTDDGRVSGMIQIRDAQKMLVIGEGEGIRGKRFDIEDTGTYLIVSNGKETSINAVAKPYRAVLNISLDGQRIFSRKRDLLVVGDNPATGQLEARLITVDGSRLVEKNSLTVPNTRAGVRVYDFSEQTDELLLGGVTASGQPAFMTFNLSSGETAGVELSKPGDDMALFVGNSRLRSRLTSGGGAAAGMGSLLGGSSKK